MIRLHNLQDSLHWKEYVDALEKECISCYWREDEKGEYVKIVPGISFYQKDLYIKDENKKKAMLVLGDLRQKWNLKEMQNRWKEEEEAEKKTAIPWYKNNRFVLNVLCVSWILGILLSILCIAAIWFL